MIGSCLGELPSGSSFFRRYIMPAEARCQANRGINAVGFSKLTKYCDSFRFLKLFCVHFCWEGTCLAFGVHVKMLTALFNFKSGFIFYSSATAAAIRVSEHP